MTIKYLDKEFTTKEIDLSFKDKAYFFLLQYRKIVLRYTNDIDTSIIDNYTERMQYIQTVIEQSKDYLENIKDTATPEEIKTTTDRIELNEKLLQDLTEEIKQDKQYQLVSRMLKESENYALLSMISNVEMVRELLTYLLNEDISEVDLSSKEGQLFSVHCINFFFKNL